MDEMRITSEFTRGIVSKLIERLLKKKLRYDANIQLNDFRAHMIDGKTRVHVDVDFEIDKDELLKILGNMS